MKYSFNNISNPSLKDISFIVPSFNYSYCFVYNLLVYYACKFLPMNYLSLAIAFYVMIVILSPGFYSKGDSIKEFNTFLWTFKAAMSLTIYLCID